MPSIRQGARKCNLHLHYDAMKMLRAQHHLLLHQMHIRYRKKLAPSPTSRTFPPLLFTSFYFSSSFSDDPFFAAPLLFNSSFSASLLPLCLSSFSSFLSCSAHHSSCLSFFFSVVLPSRPPFLPLPITPSCLLSLLISPSSSCFPSLECFLPYPSTARLHHAQSPSPHPTPSLHLLQPPPHFRSSNPRWAPRSSA